MNDTWRLFDSGLLTAAENMALDKVIVTARSRKLAPNTVRFLLFSPHCALVGYHQAVELEVEEKYCQEHGIDINRRITGGGNLYWDEGTLGWEIIAGKDTPGIPKRLEEMYRLMCESTVAGLKRFGIKARFRPKNDIEVDGRKISGTGGTEIGNAFIYQGSLLTDFDVDTMISCLKLPLKKLENKEVQSFKQRVTCLREIMSYTPPMSEIKKALLEGFEEVLGINLAPGELTGYEKELFEEELPVFQSRRSELQHNDLNVVDYKSPGGLIRVAIRLDGERHLIKSVFITGDFFAYPERSILDLEAMLKNSSSDEREITENVHRFFAENNVRIPSATADDFCRVISMAVKQDR